MTPDQMRDASLLELFKLEAEAQAQVLNSGLLVLERDPRHAGSLESCMRAAHSLKGVLQWKGRSVTLLDEQIVQQTIARSLG